MPALALISDLMMQSQTAGAAARAGVKLQTVSTVDALLTKAEAGQPRLVILDLSHPGLDVAQLVPRLIVLLGEEGTIMAFGPHVHHDRLQAANEAGCQLVISRGQFHAQADEILRQYAG